MAILLLGIMFIAAAGVAAYFFVFHKANPPLNKSEVKIGNNVFNVEIASTTIEKARGLSFRERLGDSDGMLFIFNEPAVQSFWMIDMNFSIDMIWIGGGKVLGFAENVPAPTSAISLSSTVRNSPDGTDRVLEVNAGAVAKENIKVGDAVQIGYGG